MKYNYHYGPLGYLVQVTDAQGRPAPYNAAWVDLIDCHDPLTSERA